MVARGEDVAVYFEAEFKGEREDREDVLFGDSICICILMLVLSLEIVGVWSAVM